MEQAPFLKQRLARAYLKVSELFCAWTLPSIGGRKPLERLPITNPDTLPSKDCKPFLSASAGRCLMMPSIQALFIGVRDAEPSQKCSIIRRIQWHGGIIRQIR